MSGKVEAPQKELSFLEKFHTMAGKKCEEWIGKPAEHQREGELAVEEESALIRDRVATGALRQGILGGENLEAVKDNCRERGKITRFSESRLTLGELDSVEIRLGRFIHSMQQGIVSPEDLSMALENEIKKIREGELPEGELDFKKLEQKRIDDELKMIIEVYKIGRLDSESAGFLTEEQGAIREALNQKRPRNKKELAAFIRSIKGDEKMSSVLFRALADFNLNGGFLTGEKGDYGNTRKEISAERMLRFVAHKGEAIKSTEQSPVTAEVVGDHPSAEVAPEVASKANISERLKWCRGKLREIEKVYSINSDSQRDLTELAMRQKLQERGIITRETMREALKKSELKEDNPCGVMLAKIDDQYDDLIRGFLNDGKRNYEGGVQTVNNYYLITQGWVSPEEFLRHFSQEVDRIAADRQRGVLGIQEGEMAQDGGMENLYALAAKRKLEILREFLDGGGKLANLYDVKRYGELKLDGREDKDIIQEMEHIDLIGGGYLSFNLATNYRDSDKVKGKGNSRLQEDLRLLRLFGIKEGQQ